jgi:iron complex transport system substrate-binding protein
MQISNHKLKNVLIILFLLFFYSCSNNSSKKESFIQIGDFTVNKISEERTEVRDGAGRKLVLIPRNATAPKDVEPYRIVRVPVQRITAAGYFDIATLKALGVLEETLVGVTHPEEDWYVEEVKEGMRQGRIAYIGDSDSIDFERLRKQQPELVLTWDHSIIPMLGELGIPCAITSTPTAMCLNARMRFVKFLAPFFNREEEAEQFFARVNDTLWDIREHTKEAGPPPKVMWGDIYEKRVLVEPGNAWVGELVGLAQSDYLFDDVFGTSCIEIAVERFLYDGEDADIFFTYRTKKDGVTSKAALARMNPLLADIRPIREGKVFVPMPHYSQQSGYRLDEVLTEIASILHPEVYPDFERKFFVELPETDPESKEGA